MDSWSCLRDREADRPASGSKDSLGQELPSGLGPPLLHHHTPSLPRLGTGALQLVKACRRRGGLGGARGRTLSHVKCVKKGARLRTD